MLVTFWASEFFVSSEGQEIQQGQTLKVGVIRQTEAGFGQTVRLYATIYGYIIFGLLVLAFLLACRKGADTLPVWACYDNLLLISHLPLLNVNMPAETVIFLTTLQKILSLQFFPLESSLIEILNKDALNENLGVIFFQSGYESVLSLVNMARFLVLFALMIVLAYVASHLDKRGVWPISKGEPNGRTFIHVWTWRRVVANMTLRLAICLQTPIFVSVLINVMAPAH